MTFCNPSHRLAGESRKWPDPDSGKGNRDQPKISLFGHFGQGNFGNESTLQAILYQLRRRVPAAEVTCICTGPETVAADYKIAAVQVSGTVVKSWNVRHPLARLMRKLFIGIPSELYRWLKSVKTLRGTDALIVPGTGLLTDAYGLFSWGPYNLFKWSATAKLCRCKLFFVSVGAGPIYSRVGRCLVKSALSLADFRSYRDESTIQYLKSIGFPARNDRVYPDLVFSFPEALIPHQDAKARRRTVVGLGLMGYAGRYSVERPRNATYLAYLDVLVTFVRWLLAHDYDVRLLIGDGGDRTVTEEFKSVLKLRLERYEEGRIIDEPIASVESLLSQLAATDLVVATRFHNVLLSLLLNKPAIAISFHHKCSSLMSQMGMAEYCEDIHNLTAESLIGHFRQLQQSVSSIKRMLRERVGAFRDALDEQYGIIFRDICPDSERAVPPAAKGKVFIATQT